MAHKKATGSTGLGRDSVSKRLGTKIGDGQKAGAGEIIVRQRGTKIHPGKNVKRGGDDTPFTPTWQGSSNLPKDHAGISQVFSKKRTFANVVPWAK